MGIRDLVLLRSTLTGYGFNAFETPERITELQRVVGWPAAAFHSEYIDLLLGVGCIGAFLYVFIILSGLKRTLVTQNIPDEILRTGVRSNSFLLAIMLLESPGRDQTSLHLCSSQSWREGDSCSSRSRSWQQ